MSVLENYSKAFNLTWKVIALSIVNIILSLLDFEAINRALSFRGIHIGFKFHLPTIIVRLWDLVSLPGGQGYSATTQLASVEGMPMILVILFMLLLMLLTSIVAYIYLRIIVVKAIGREVPLNYIRIIDLFLFQLLIMALMLLIVPIAFANIATGILFFILMLIIYYFIYATPFIIVIHDRGLMEALKQSISLAMRGEYLGFTLIYIVVTLILSPMYTILVVDGKIAGLIISFPLAGITGLWLTTATTLMIIELTTTTTIQTQ